MILVEWDVQVYGGWKRVCCGDKVEDLVMVVWFCSRVTARMVTCGCIGGS